MRLNDNTVLITGGGSGIGRALAVALADHGNTVLICGRRRHVLDLTADSHDLIHAYECDVTDRDSIDAMLHKIGEDGFSINVLINNAGILTHYNMRHADRFDLDAVERDLRANLNGPIDLVGRLLPSLLECDNAAIINVGSPGGVIPVSPYPIYAASKAGLHAWTQVLRHHLRGLVKVIEVFPPTVETEMTTIVRRKKVSAESCAANILKGLAAGKDEIWIGEGRAVRWMTNLLPPSLCFRLVNAQPSMKE